MTCFWIPQIFQWNGGGGWTILHFLSEKKTQLDDWPGFQVSMFRNFMIWLNLAEFRGHWIIRKGKWYEQIHWTFNCFRYDQFCRPHKILGFGICRMTMCMILSSFCGNLWCSSENMYTRQKAHVEPLDEIKTWQQSYPNWNPTSGSCWEQIQRLNASCRLCVFGKEPTAQMEEILREKQGPQVNNPQVFLYWCSTWEVSQA